MYKVYFEIWRGYNPTASLHPGGSFDTLDEAIDVAKKCYGYVWYYGNIISDHRIR